MSISTPTVSLAALKPIGPKNVNPHAAEAERIAKQLCFELGIGLPHIDNYTTQAGYLFPETGLQRLITMILFFNFLYYIDDVYDRHKQSAAREDNDYLHETFRTAAKILVTGNEMLIYNDEPILKAAYEQYLQFTSQSPKIWLDRFTSNILAHLKSSLVDLEDSIQPNETLLQRYNRLRDFDCGMEPTLDLIEFAHGTVIGAQMLGHPIIQTARYQVARYCGLSNDLFSYEKEVIFHGSNFNIVAVLVAEGHTFEEAVDMVIDMLNAMIEKFEELESQLPLYEDHLMNYTVAQYFKGLRQELAAAYYWQFDTTRYRSPNSPFIELRGEFG